MEPNLALQKPLEDYIEYWETLTPRSLRLIEKLTEPGMAFKNPFYDVVGVDAFEHALQQFFSYSGDFKFKVADYAWGRDGATVYLRWSLNFSRKGKKKRIDGVSEVLFSKKGKVLSHSDHWDSGAQFYADLPLLGDILRRIKNKIAT